MSRGSGSLRRPRPAMVLGLVATIFLVVFVVQPYLHHSDACHATTPWHCTACSLQMTSPSVADDGLLALVVRLPDAGTLPPDALPHDRVPLVTRTQDRSPPA